MSNHQSPELPDLDRLEALARAATPGSWTHHYNGYGDMNFCMATVGTHSIKASVAPKLHSPCEADAAFIAAANPAAVLALVELARRAQPEGEARCVICGSAEPRTGTCGSDDPRALCNATAGKPEGEAPQAGSILAELWIAEGMARDAAAAIVAMPRKELKAAYLESVEELLAWKRRALEAEAKIAAPAAQHADSGAPTAESLASCSPQEVAAFEAWAAAEKFDMATHPLHWLFLNERTNAARKGWKAALEFARAALAAQSLGAHAPVPHWHSTLPRDRAYVDPRSLREQAMCAEIAALRAQQAAAPGASIDTEEFAKLLTEYVQANMVKYNDFRAAYLREKLVSHINGRLAPSAPGTPEAPQTAAARDVLAERQRQVEQEGWTPAHDDMHGDGQMAVAAGYYALASGSPYERSLGRGHMPVYWPWAPSWWKPRTRRNNLVRAGALVLAEIERLDRAAQLDGGQGEEAAHG